MSDIDWSAIRDDYEAGKSSLSALEREYGVSRQAIKKRANRENWVTASVTPPHKQVTGKENSNGNTSHDINALARVHMALKIYLEERPSWDEIAARSGFASRGACHNAVKRELERRVTHDVQMLRDEELFMLQNIQAKCYKTAMDKENDGWTWAADRFMAASKRKSELMGLDAKPDALPDGVTIIRNYNVEVGQV